MTNLISSGITSSSAWRPGFIPPPVIVGSSLAALNEPPAFDEEWEAPTPEEWRRVLAILAMQWVREVLHGGSVAPRGH